jgi:hypothetical protein
MQQRYATKSLWGGAQFQIGANTVVLATRCTVRTRLMQPGLSGLQHCHAAIEAGQKGGGGQPRELSENQSPVKTSQNFLQKEFGVNNDDTKFRRTLKNSSGKIVRVD